VAAVVWLSLDLTLCGSPGRTLLLFGLLTSAAQATPLRARIR